jgi:hypothetical protein
LHWRGERLDPQYLESLRQRARRITLQAGEKIEVGWRCLPGDSRGLTAAG